VFPKLPLRDGPFRASFQESTATATAGAIALESRLEVAARTGATGTAVRAREAPALKSDATRVRTTRLGSWESIPDLETAWHDLLDRSPGCSVFQTFPWHVAWWKSFGRPHELFVILAHANSRLVGIAPMMITREKGPIGHTRRHVHFIGSTNNASDYCDFITDPDVSQALDALLEELCSDPNAFHRIDLSHFPGQSPNQARTLDYFRKRGIKTTVEFQAECPVRILGDAQADLKTANKASLNRHTNYFRKSGNLRFHRCASEGEILGFLDAFFAQHITRRNLTGSPSQFLDPGQQAFYRELVRELLPRGWLRFDAALFNDAPLAFHFGFEYRGRFIWYKPAFDVRFASRSPGEVLIKFLLEDAIGRKLEEFDFTVGSEGFKYRFANQIRCINRLTAFHSTADYWRRRARQVLKKLLTRKPVSSGALQPSR
jgi:CelD/BcsL family acetyltransferase involved in cellulose biosynthesis